MAAMNPDAPIVGDDVPDQGRLRPTSPVRTLDEFLQFLAWMEAAFGPIARPATVTSGSRFLL